MYQYPAHRISYQLVTFLLFHRRIFASAKKNIDFMKDSIDFGNMEIPRLFRKLLIPTVLGMVFSAIFVITDGIFVGKGIGSDALAAVNITAPLFMITTGIGLMFGVGASVVASIHLSQGKRKVASINITQALAFSSLLILVLSALCCYFAEPIGRLLGSSERLLPLVVEYMNWYVPFLVFYLLLSAGMFYIRLIAQLCYDVQCRISHYQYRTRLYFHLPIRLGNDGSCLCHQFGNYGRRIDDSYLSTPFFPQRGHLSYQT